VRSTPPRRHRCCRSGRLASGRRAG
jgi:hypothetical protein